MSMQNSKPPGIDGLTTEFFVTIWEDIKDVFLSSCHIAKLKKELSTSQRQTIIKLIEKKDKDQKFIIISKALVSRFKKVITDLIPLQQMAYVENGFIGESGRLIADIIEITDVPNKKGFLVTMDIKIIY